MTVPREPKKLRYQAKPDPYGGPEAVEAARIAQAMLDSMPEAVRETIEREAMRQAMLGPGPYPEHEAARFAERMAREWLEDNDASR